MGEDLGRTLSVLKIPKESGEDWESVWETARGCGRLREDAEDCERVGKWGETGRAQGE